MVSGLYIYLNFLPTEDSSIARTTRAHVGQYTLASKQTLLVAHSLNKRGTYEALFMVKEKWMLFLDS